MALDKKEREELTERIIDALHSVYDPEIPVDVYELGLIYDVTVSEDGSKYLIAIEFENILYGISFDKSSSEIITNTASLADL